MRRAACGAQGKKVTVETRDNAPDMLRRRRPPLPIAALCALVALTFGFDRTVSADVFPGDTWEMRAPADLGLDAAGLDAFSAMVGGRGCVARSGYMVHTWGDQALSADVSSAAKPWYTHFLFQAIENGLLASVDDYAVDHEPCLDDINAALGFKDRQITFRHLANQTSTYGVSELPGDAFDYNDFQMALFWDTLFLKVQGATYANVDATVLHPFTETMQFQDASTFLAFGLNDRQGRLALSVRDFARFGLLYANEGQWNGSQLLDPAWVALATTDPLPASLPTTSAVAAEMCPGQRSIGGGLNQSPHMGSYSWLWWVNGVDLDGGRLWPDAPVDAYGAFGHWGSRVLFVIPSLDLVVSFNDSGFDSIATTNQAWAILLDAILPTCNASAPATADLGNHDVTNCLRRVSVPDGVTVAADVAGRNCRRTESAADQYFYFDVDDAFAFEGNLPAVNVTIEFHDASPGNIELQYDAMGEGAAAITQSAGSVELTGTETWIQHTFTVYDAFFGNRQSGGADLRFHHTLTTLHVDNVRIHDALGLPVPTLSQWGIIVMALLLQIVGTVVLGNRYRTLPA